MEKFCKICQEIHGDELWLLQAEYRRCRIWRAFTKQEKFKDFKQYKAEFLYKLNSPRKSKEELKLIKKRYDFDLRKNLSEEQKLALKERKNKYNSSEKGKKSVKKQNAKRYATPEGALSSRLRAQIRFHLNKRVSGGVRYLPFSIPQLKEHLESLFLENMSWENRSKWHIDHKIPLKFKNEDRTFFWNQEELGNPESETFKKAWALNNLQPMWASDNIKKSNKAMSE